MRKPTLALLIVLAIGATTLHPTSAVRLDPPGADHVVLDATAAVLEARGLPVIDEYASYATSRITEDEANALKADGYLPIPVDHRTGRGAYFKDLKNGLTVPSDLQAPANSPYVIVQFRGPIKAAWRADLDARADAVYDYLPHNALLAKVSPTQQALLAGLAHVRHVEPYHPALKLMPGMPTEGVNSYLLFAHPEASLDAVVAAVEAAGATVELSLTTNLQHVVRFSGSYEVAKAVARVSTVSSVETGPRTIEFDNDRSSAMLQSGQIGSHPFHARNLTGKGQVAGVCDAGITTQVIATPHPDHPVLRAVHFAFAEEPGSANETFVFNPDPLGPPYSHRKIVTYYAPRFPPLVGPYYGDGQDSPTSGHGSGTAGTLGGDTQPWNERTGTDGVAPGVKLAICDIHVLRPFDSPFLAPGTNDTFTYAIPDPRAYFEEGYLKGARVWSNSWGIGSPAFGEPLYLHSSHLYDAFLRERPYLLMVQSAGNQANVLGKDDWVTPGRHQPESLSKNVISVGATEADHTNITGFSNFSPCGTPLIKPNLVALGRKVETPTSGTESGTKPNHGTSFATPAVAGAAVLVKDYFAKGFYPTGDNATGKARNVTSALTRAILAISAREIPGDRGCDQYPNSIQGWGFPTLADALPFDDAPKRIRVFDTNETSPLATGATWTTPVEVQTAGHELRVFLAWTDFPGAPFTANSLVNNLDLRVIGPSGNVHVANAFVVDTSGAGLPPEVPQGLVLPDAWNTEEAVFLRNASAGIYTVEVRGLNVPVGPQSFAVAITGRLKPVT